MNKRIWISFILCAVLALSGCGNAKQTVTTTIPSQEDVTTVPTEQTEPVEQQTEEPTDMPTLPPVEGVDGTTLFESDRFAFVLKEISETTNGQLMSAVAINRTDMTVYMRLMNLSVNGFMMENLPTVRIEPGQMLGQGYFLPGEELARNGIETITDIQFNLWVYDSEDFTTPDVADGLCRYFPFGSTKAPDYPRESQPADQVLVDNDRFTITITSCQVADQVVLQLHLLNKSDMELLFIAPYALMNQEVADPLWAYNVSAGKQRNTQITMELPQEALETLELCIQVGDHQDWSAGLYYQQNFQVELPE